MRPGKWLNTALTFSCCFLLACQSFAGESKYAKKYKPFAILLSGEFGIPCEVILGIAIVESAHGQGLNAKEMNNHFGIVGKNRLSHRKSKYRQYPNAEASFRHFCQVIAAKKFYAALKGNSDHSLWIEAISKSGYSAHPLHWKNKVLKVIKDELDCDTKQL